MALKYASTPQLKYGNQWGGSRFTSRLPAGVQPIRTAPTTSQAIVVYETNGRPRWALNHNGAWRELKPFRDNPNDPTKVSWRMDGTLINAPIAWSAQPPQRRR